MSLALLVEPQCAFDALLLDTLKNQCGFTATIISGPAWQFIYPLTADCFTLQR